MTQFWHMLWPKVHWGPIGGSIVSWLWCLWTWRRSTLGLGFTTIALSTSREFTAMLLWRRLQVTHHYTKGVTK